MPSVYAHYRFGRDIYELLPEEPKACVTKYRELFDIGLQGPDILFFYRPIFHNYVNQLGYQIHKWQGRRFFQTATRMIRNRQKKEASIAYLCGVACHYALDLVCHPYVEELVKYQHMNHCAIEGAFERCLIVEDHLPLDTLVTGSIKPSKQNAAVIHRFYGRTTGKQVLSALRCMVWCNDALRMKDNIMKKTIFFLIRLVGKYNSIAGMIITPEPSPEFSESDVELRRRYDMAKPIALNLIAELLSNIASGQRLSKQFNATFNG